MHKFNASFTTSGAQLVEIELEGPKMIRIGKHPTTSAIVLGEDGESLESRLYGSWVTPSLVLPKEGQSESDTLARLEQAAREQSSAGSPPKLIVIRAGALRGYIAFPLLVRPDAMDGFLESYTLGIPAICL